MSGGCLRKRNLRGRFRAGVGDQPVAAFCALPTPWALWSWVGVSGRGPRRAVVVAGGGCARASSPAPECSSSVARDPRARLLVPLHAAAGTCAPSSLVLIGDQQGDWSDTHVRVGCARGGCVVCVFWGAGGPGGAGLRQPGRVVGLSTTSRSDSPPAAGARGAGAGSYAPPVGPGSGQCHVPGLRLIGRGGSRSSCV